jgi:hypothetical protein
MGLTEQRRRSVASLRWMCVALGGCCIALAVSQLSLARGVRDVWFNTFVWTPPGPYIAAGWLAGVAVGILAHFIWRSKDPEIRRYRFWTTLLALLGWTFVAGTVHLAVVGFATFARGLAAPMPN